MTPQRAVGAVVHDAAGRLLVVRRGNPPARGRWSLPGGRVEPGEEARAACAREVLEETGLVVAVGRELGSVRIDAEGHSFDVTDFACTVAQGELVAGDDAADVRWVTAEQLGALPTSQGLVEALTRWGAMPQAGGRPS